MSKKISKNLDYDEYRTFVRKVTSRSQSFFNNLFFVSEKTIQLNALQGYSLIGTLYDGRDDFPGFTLQEADLVMLDWLKGKLSEACSKPDGFYDPSLYLDLYEGKSLIDLAREAVDCLEELIPEEVKGKGKREVELIISRVGLTGAAKLR